MSTICRVTRLLLPLLVFVAACAPPPDVPSSDDPQIAIDPNAAPPSVTNDRPDVDLSSALASGQPVRVIVMLDTAKLGMDTGARSLTAQDVARRSVAFANLKHDLFANAPASLELGDELENLPLASATLKDADALAHLLADPSVARVVPDQINTISLAQSLPLISQPAAVAEGKDGTGTAVAVLDTGADWHVADLGSCTAVGQPASCRVAWAQDFATQDNLLDDSGKHGTNTSSIVAQVAPGTKIIALDVFDGTAGYDSVIINAINWVIANRATYNIVAMNLSLGGGSYTAACDGTPMAVAIAEARRVGVLAAIATGNSAKTNAISSPACASAAVSVGAVYDANVGALNSAVCSDATSTADKVTCFSNSASFMSMLAPGAFITAGGVSMAGTSQATPHVAGAMAVLRGAFPTETADDAVARLTGTGPSITDTRNGVVKPRLNVQAAAAGCVFKLTPSPKSITSADSSFELSLATTSSCTWSITSNASWLTLNSASTGQGSATLSLHASNNAGAVRSATVTVSGASNTGTATVVQGVDTAAPTGTVVINDGAAFTRTTTVALTLTATDPSGVASMCVTTGSTCTTFEAFNTAKVFSLTATQGVQTVRVFLKDALGNVTAAASAPTDTITLDTTAPTGGTALATPGIASNTLTWTAATDAMSGVAKYRVVFAPSTAPATCATGTQLYEGTALTFTHSSLTNGTVYAYRVCALDGAGNVGAGVTTSAMPRPEFDGPVGVITLNAGATFTRTTAVTVGLSATDASTVTEMCVTTALPCTAWVPLASTKAVTLPAGDGTKTVYALFRDQWTNVSAAAATATIALDTIAPTASTATSTYGDASATVNWTAATDVTSGLSGYRVVYAPTTAPANCTTGTVGYEGTALTASISGLTNGTLYAFRVCALDKAGNVNAGVVTSTQPRPESDGPVGTVSINSAAQWTKSTAVTLTLAATDASTVSQVCVSSTATCTAWQAFAASKPFTLAAPDGSKTVYAFFKDQWNNVSSAAATASIVLDTLAPTAITVTSTYGDATATVNWTAATDATSGLVGYRVVYAATTAPANCATGTVAYEGSALTATVSGLTNGTLYGFRVCALDKAGNVSTGSITSTQPRPESDGPVGGLTLNGGAQWTNTTAVTVTLSPTDASTVSQVCLSSTATCTAWQAFASSKTFTLAAPDGTKTVYALFKDQWNNVSTAAVSKTIVLDQTVPTALTASSVYGDTDVTVSWTASTDVTSGLAKYRVVFAPTTAPANCSAGTVAYEGPDLSFKHSGLTNGTLYAYRVCAIDKAGNVNAGAITSAQPRPESDGPVAVFSINAGATYTKSAAVALTLAPTDASTVTQVCVSTTTTCTAWVALPANGATLAFTLPAPDGTKTLYARFKDQWNNVSAVAAQQSIVLDTIAPGTLTATSAYGDASASLTWSAATDATSGLAGYRVVYAPTTAPATCATGTVGYEGSALTATLSGLTNGTLYAFRICALDKAGNVNAGVVTSTQPRPESEGPVAAFTINGGATWTKSLTVSLALAPTDASTVTQVCISTTATCTAWQAWTATMSFGLPVPDGSKTLYVRFKDQWNNVSAVAATRTIVLDTTVPSSGTATVTYGDASNALSWTASTDATSGLDVYRVYVSTAGLPAGCSGTIAYEGTATSFSHTGLTNGQSYGYRVCAFDKAANNNVGATGSAQPRPESLGPIADFTINGGATVTKSAAVTLTLNPTDASTVTQVCISTTATCTAWQTYSATKTFTLPAPDGNKTVYVTFKDQWNNASAAAASKVIQLDTTAPGETVLSGVAGSSQASLSWAGSTDAMSGVSAYRLVGLAGSTLPAAGCSNGTVLAEGSARSFVHLGLVPGATWSYRVCVIDVAGNITAGSTSVVKVLP